jgi:hypothetical protein
MVLSASVFGIVGSVTKHYVIAFIALIPYIISAFAIIKIRKAEKNSTNPSAPTPKENPTILKNNPSLSPNMSEVDKLTKQIESIKNDFKIINHEVDNSIFNQFNLLKKNLYLEYEKINWKENTNKEISEKYQTVIDSYVEAMDNEYLKIKEKFNNVMKKDVEDRIKNIQIIQDSK